MGITQLTLNYGTPSQNDTQISFPGGISVEAAAAPWYMGKYQKTIWADRPPSKIFNLLTLELLCSRGRNQSVTQLMQCITKSCNMGLLLWQGWKILNYNEASIIVRVSFLIGCNHFRADTLMSEFFISNLGNVVTPEFSSWGKDWGSVSDLEHVVVF